ncbi:MAG: ABC transporter permease, partial [Chloroflexota bacterium]
PREPGCRNHTGQPRCKPADAKRDRPHQVNVDAGERGSFGFAAGLAGVISASRFSRATNDAGQGLELISIAAVVIGGTSIMGGEGAIWRTVLGVMLLRLIENGFNLINVDTFYQDIFQGLIILFAVALDAARHRR